MGERTCICQVCTCPEKMHKCKYEEGEEGLREQGMQHCRSCGTRQKRRAPYRPKGPMELMTTYNEEFQPKDYSAEKASKKRETYRCPAGPMELTTTYGNDFTQHEATAIKTSGPRSTYLRPKGDMELLTTYNDEFQPKGHSEQRVTYRPKPYVRPLGPMDLETTYGQDFTEKQSDIVACCPCCDLGASGYVQEGEQDGHVMLVRRSA